MSRRTEKVSSLIQKEVGPMLVEMELPGLVTISKVETSDDLNHAKIWITVMPAGVKQEAAVMDLIHNNLYRMQGALNRKLKMRAVPRIAFTIDHSEEYADHINQLIRKTKDQNDD